MSNQQMLDIDEYNGWRQEIDIAPEPPERDLNPPEEKEEVESDPDYARDNFINIDDGRFGCNQTFRSKIEQDKIMRNFYKAYKKIG